MVWLTIENCKLSQESELIYIVMYIICLLKCQADVKFPELFKIALDFLLYLIPAYPWAIAMAKRGGVRLRASPRRVALSAAHAKAGSLTRIHIAPCIA